MTLLKIFKIPGDFLTGKKYPEKIDHALSASWQDEQIIQVM
jgi:hypothetical protein